MNNDRIVMLRIPAEFFNRIMKRINSNSDSPISECIDNEYDDLINAFDSIYKKDIIGDTIREVAHQHVREVSTGKRYLADQIKLISDAIRNKCFELGSTDTWISPDAYIYFKNYDINEDQLNELMFIDPKKLYDNQNLIYGILEKARVMFNIY